MTRIRNRAGLSVSALLGALLSLSCSRTTYTPGTLTTEQKEVRQLAEDVFLKRTGGAITDYTIASKDYDQHWTFLIRGTGEDGGLGNHWLVRIGKKDRRIEFLEGE